MRQFLADIARSAFPLWLSVPLFAAMAFVVSYEAVNGTVRWSSVVLLLFFLLNAFAKWFTRRVGASEGHS